MSGPRYKLYVKKAFDLARSLVVKSELTANAINRELELLGHKINPYDPHSWKYYRNLAGEYHETDQLMTVNSLDTLEPIALTKENLELHRATANGYRQDPRYYNALLERYPEQELLIRGILFPVDIDAAIAAPDGKILGYDATLIEENETNLIPKLQEWIDGFFARWNVPAYAIIDDLYAASMLGVMFLNIPKIILNIRLANCKTNYVHSFHIREYLASHGRLDVFMDYLTKKQALFLYRNIRYLHRHAGKWETFQLLLDRLLTERGIPLASYEMRHNLENLTRDLYPEIEMMLTYLNFGVGEDARIVRTVSEVLEKEIPLAPGNYNENQEAQRTVPAAMKQSMISRLPTKVLESIVTDLSRNTAYSFEELLLNHWLYMSTHQRYNAFIAVTNPLTGEQMTLSARDAFVVYLYAYNKACGITLKQVPTLIANDVWRPQPPKKEELMAVVDPAYVDEAVIDEALRDNPSMGVYISTEAFYGFCESLQRELERHRLLYVFEEHHAPRGQIEGMLQRFFHQPTCDLAGEALYEDWLEDRGLSILSEISAADASILAADLLKETTGIDLRDNSSLRELQAAMLNLMAQLSSYTVQYLQTINSNTFLRAEWSAIRLGDILERSLAGFTLDQAPVRVIDLKGRGKVRLRSKLGDRPVAQIIRINYNDTLSCDISLDARIRCQTYAKNRAPIARIRLMDIEPSQASETRAAEIAALNVLSISPEPTPLP